MSFIEVNGTALRYELSGSGARGRADPRDGRHARKF